MRADRDHDKPHACNLSAWMQAHVHEFLNNTVWNWEDTRHCRFLLTLTISFHIFSLTWFDKKRKVVINVEWDKSLVINQSLPHKKVCSSFTTLKDISFFFSSQKTLFLNTFKKFHFFLAYLTFFIHCGGSNDDQSMATDPNLDFIKSLC